MTSSSGVESSNMDDNDDYQFTRVADGKEKKNKKKNNKKNKRNDDELIEEDGEGEVALWEKFTKNFQQVQSVLDQNRVLIQQVNENHQSKLPDNLTKNVALIKEINGNISTVVSLYSNLSANFTNVFHHQRRDGGGGGGQEEENQQQQQQQSPEEA